MRRYNAFEEMEQMFERMSRQFDEMSRQWDGPMGGTSRMGASKSGMRIDVADYDDRLVVTADVPGFEKEEIDLTLSEGSLTIVAGRESETETEGEEGEFIRRERRSTSLRRTIGLPETIDEDATSASYTNGVLTVTLPKLSFEGEAGRRIDIN
jgi:HSP20 family protein